MAYLIDTNVISELRKGPRCHPQVRAWRQRVAYEETFLSVITFGELRRGIEKLRLREPSGADVLRRWIRGLELSYGNRILSVSLEIANLWGGLSVAQPLPTADGLLAATALHHGLTLVTRNTADFQRSGVDYFNPFAD